MQKNFKKKMVLIPADGIKNEISRSFFLAKYLSKYYEVYYLERPDVQNMYFESIDYPKLYSLKCFFSGIFTISTIRKHPRYEYYFFKVPFLSYNVINKIIGISNAYLLSKKINKLFLNSFIKKNEIDIIFYADGCDTYPIIPFKKCILDIQDDFDDSDFRNSKPKIKKYFDYTYKNATYRYIVSTAAQSKFTEKFKVQFEFLPNGAEADDIRNVNPIDVLNRIKELNLEDKYIVSYIGGDAWVDKDLIEKVLEITSNNKIVHYLFVGNLPLLANINLDNFTYLGPVKKEEAYIYYHMSDVGVLFKDSEKSDFLINSIPLKLIQYGVLNKKMIVPKISWVLEEGFENIVVLQKFTPANLANEIISFQKGPKSNKWNTYEWNTLVRKVYANLECLV